mgnify:CR=1 FL=1
MVSPGRARISRNPSRRESRSASAGPVCSCAQPTTHCARDRGCSVRPAFPAPSPNEEGETKEQDSGKTCREIANVYLQRCLKCESRSIPIVVPAQAGTHNHECELVCSAGTTSLVHNICCGVWVPACAGTTAENAQRSRAIPTFGCSCSASDCRARPVRGCCASRRRGGLWWCRAGHGARCRSPCGSCCPRELA